MLVCTPAARAACSASRVVSAADGLRAGVMPVTWNHLAPAKTVAHGTMPGWMSAMAASLAIVQDAAGPRRGAELQEIQADAVVVGPDDVLGADAGLAGAVGDQPAQRIVGQPRHPGRRMAQPGQADRGVQLGAADLNVEAAGLLQPAKVRRTEANHRFAEGDHVVWHRGFSQMSADKVLYGSFAFIFSFTISICFSTSAFASGRAFRNLSKSLFASTSLPSRSRAKPRVR